MSFHRDNAWQRQVRDKILGPGFYGAYALDGRYVFLDRGRLVTLLQKRFAVDTIIQGRDGAAFCIEEKIVRWPSSGKAHTAFALETDSCTKPGHKSPGWMHYGKADFLLYCFQLQNDDLDCHLIDFPVLQRWFWEREDEFHVFGPLKTLNASKGRLVPIDRVHAEVRAWRRLVPATVRAVAA